MICFLRGMYIDYTDTEPTSPSSRGPALSVNSHFDNRTCALVHHLTPTRYIKADEIGAVLNYFRARPESVLVPTPQLVIATKIEELVSDEMVVHTYQAVPIFAKVSYPIRRNL